jgi:RimJ/RimL family protein N-acetyltransferase
MIIKKYGIELHRLEKGDLELLRKHRNSNAVKSKMFYRQHISEEQQADWFETVNNIYHYYFIVHFKGKKVGLAHGKILSFENRAAEGGIFLWESKLLDTHVPAIISICMTDLTFRLMQMKTTSAVVRKDNKVAINYNLKLGYKIIEEKSDDQKAFMILSAEDYILPSESLRKTIQKMTKDFSDLEWDDIIFPPNIDASLYEGLPAYLDEKVKIKLEV